MALVHSYARVFKGVLVKCAGYGNIRKKHKFKQMCRSWYQNLLLSLKKYAFLQRNPFYCLIFVIFNKKCVVEQCFGINLSGSLT